VTDDALSLGRAAYERRAWASAYAHLTDADDGGLTAEDLNRRATAAYLLGRNEESFAIRERAYNDGLERGDTRYAARTAFWLWFSLLIAGDRARAGGWYLCARDAIARGDEDCVERGMIKLPEALMAMFGGDAEASAPVFEEVIAIGDRFHDPDVATLGRLGRGQSLLALGRVQEGIALLDQAMLAVTADSVSPVMSGLVYCSVIDTCQESFDLQRAREWTQALASWCAEQPDLVPFRGQCMVHRAQLARLQGAWDAALDEADRACRALAEPAHPALGAAWYEKGELHRLRGDFTAAEDAYRQASQCGREPQPGLAQLRLFQGRVDASAAAIRRVAVEQQERAQRLRVLTAYAEIALAVDDIGGAGAAADELEAIVADTEAPFLAALVSYIRGAVALAGGDAQRAIGPLRDAATRWHDLEAPYDTARARVLVGAACRDLGDTDGAELEWDAAQAVFARLGAGPDLERLGEMRRGPAPTAGGLTGREIEVLGLLAAGKTNREIATELVISDRTVARHVSNIFVKIGVQTRAAATAYAFTHDLV
jgi:DNA-binding CsgD family transcriptional regulator